MGGAGEVSGVRQGVQKDLAWRMGQACGAQRLWVQIQALGDLGQVPLLL